MYESIYKYAREHNLTSVRNRAMRICTAYICISEEGVYDRLDVVPKEYRVFFASAFWRKMQNFLENIASPKRRKVQSIS